MKEKYAADLPPDHGAGAGETILASQPAGGPQDHARGPTTVPPAGTSMAAAKRREITIATTRPMDAGTPTRKDCNSDTLKI